MLNKAAQKWIRSLEHKKYRQELGLFIAEGNKLAHDLLPLLPCKLLVATPDWLKTNGQVNALEVISADQETLNRISQLQHPQEVLGVFEIPDYQIKPKDLKGTLSLALDNIQDPGNLGTILRIADWFGIDYVICSRDTADAYNPKTVQATMGAIGRVKLCYTDLYSFLPETGLPIFGTFLEGKSIYDCQLSTEGIVVMGNEGNGISSEVASLVSEKLHIPDYPAGKTGSESLNVSVATAIVCSEFRRRNS
jgi:TrmH family RNA methyltransferase